MADRKYRIFLVAAGLGVLIAASTCGPSDDSPAGTPIKLRVIDAKSQSAIMGAKIRYGYDYFAADLRSGFWGRATAVVEAGHENSPFTASVTASGYVGQSFDGGTARELAGQELTVAREEPHRLGGRVVDADGKPVANTRLCYWVFAKQKPYVFADGYVTTDEAGNWSADGFPAGNAYIVLHRGDHNDDGWESDPEPIGQALLDHTSVITLHYPLTIHFTVTDRKTGKPMTKSTDFRKTAVTTPERANMRSTPKHRVMVKRSFRSLLPDVS